MPFRHAFVPPCIPTRAYKVPAGPDWVHEIKHDGRRLQVRREITAPPPPILLPHDASSA
jgi:ATP-dependent DNA ligase